MPASNPYNPYYTIIGPEHAATALASTTPIPQSMSLAAATTTMSIHNAAQPQKRTDRVQVILFKLLFFSFLVSPFRFYTLQTHIMFTLYPSPSIPCEHKYTHKYTVSPMPIPPFPI